MQLVQSFRTGDGVVVRDFDSGLTPEEIQYVISMAGELESSIVVLVSRLDALEYHLLSGFDVKDAIELALDGLPNGIKIHPENARES